MSDAQKRARREYSERIFRQGEAVPDTSRFTGRERKLTAREALEIAKAPKGASRKEAAEKYGISCRAVSIIRDNYRRGLKIMKNDRPLSDDDIAAQIERDYYGDL